MSIDLQSRTPLARRHKRYIVSGSVVFRSSEGTTCGQLLNIAKGGLLAQTEAIHPWKAKLSLLFDVTGYPERFPIWGQVVRIDGSLLTINFLEEPEAIEYLLNWLELRHCAWSGVE